MSNEIFFDGVRYISAADAALSYSLSRDYVAKLCREGKVQGKRVGKNWYANDLTLKEFLVTQEYQRSLRRESLSGERAREYNQLNAFSERSDRKSGENLLSRAGVHMSERGSRALNAMQSAQESISSAAVPASIKSLHGRLSATAAKHGQLLADAARGLASPSLSDTAVRTFAHAPLYSISPLGELLHKATALALAFMLTFGTYGLVDQDAARFAITSSREIAQSLAADYREITGGGIGTLAQDLESQVKVAVENPGASMAAVGGFFPERLANFAKAFNEKIDEAVYAVAFPTGVVERHLAGSTGGAQVAVEIQPYARPAVVNDQAPNVASTKQLQNSNSIQTIIQNPVIERIVERVIPQKTVVEAGGLTDAYLATKLNQLENKLTAQMYAIGNANSTAIAGNYVVTAQTNRIQELTRVEINDSRFNGGTIAGAEITGGSFSGGNISGATIAATQLTVSGDTTLANATTTNFFATTASSTNLFAQLASLGSTTVASLNVGSGLSSGGGLTVSGQTTLTNFTAVNGTTTNATSTNFFATNFVGTSATTTNLFATNLVGTNATTTNLFTTRLSVDSLSLGAGITSHFVPSANDTYDLGSPSFYWRTGYIDTITTNSISAASTSIGGTNSETLTINADNATADTEDMSIIFYRGAVVPNAVFSWNSAGVAKRFEMNQPLYVSNLSGSTTQPTLTLRGSAGQTANIFQIASSTGANIFTVASDGSVTISTSTITSLTTGTSTITNLSVTNTSTSTFAGPVTFGPNYLNIISTGQVALGTAVANASALLQLDSTSRGFLPPRLTTAQKNAIASPSSGLVLFDSNLNKLNVYDGSAWKNVGSMEIGGEVTGGSQGSVIFIGDGTTLGQDAANFSFATSTNRLLLTQASTTRLSNFGTAYFGGNATTTIDSAGNVAIAGTLGVTGNTTLAQATSSTFFATVASSTNFAANSFTGGTVTLGNATSTAFFASIASSTNLFAQSASLGALSAGTTTLTNLSVTNTGTSTFAGALSAGNNTFNVYRDGTTAINGGVNLSYGYQTQIGGNGLFTTALTLAGTGGTFPLFFIDRTTSPFSFGNIYGTSIGIGSTQNVPALMANDNTVIIGDAVGGGYGISGTNTTLEVRRAAGTISKIGIHSLGTTDNSQVTFGNSMLIGGGTPTDHFSIGINTANSNAFTIANGGTLATNPRVTVTTAGNVGIGTTNPAVPLQVAGVAAATTTRVSTSNVSFDTVIEPTTNDRIIQLSNSSSLATGGFDFFAANASFGASRLRIQNNGNIGVSTTTPWAKLSVTATDNASIPQFVVASSSAVSLLVAENGRVGIGTSTPTNRLVVQDPNVATNILRVQGSRSTYLTLWDDTLQANTGTGSVSSLFLNYVGGNVIVGNNGGTGNVGVATTTPWAKLAVSAQDNASANQFVVASSSAVSLLVAANGNVGVGTNAPARLLHVAASANADSVLFGSNTSPTTESTFIDAANAQLRLAGGFTAGTYNSPTGTSSAKLLISNYDNDGTTVYPLIAVDENGGADFFVRNKISGSSLGYFQGTLGVGTSTPQSALAVSFQSGGDTGTSASNGLSLFDTSTGSAWDTANPFGVVDFQSADASGVGWGGRARIGAVMEGVGGGTSRLGLFTAPSTAGTFSERLSILSGGNVGIGTTTPTYKLDLTSSSASNVRFQTTGQTQPDILVLENQGNSALDRGAGLLFNVPLSTGSAANGGRIYVGEEGSSATSYMAFQTGITGTLSERLRITSLGNVGIGSTTPNARLVVAGNQRISGLSAGGGLFSDNGAGSGLFSFTRQDTVATGDLSISAFGGIGFKGANTTYNNAEASNFSMYLSSAGNLGIGTTTPFARLSVTGTDTSNTTRGFVFADSANAPKAIFTNGGGLVMGTTTIYNRATPLQISSGAGLDYARFCREDGSFFCSFFNNSSAAFAQVNTGSGFFTWTNAATLSSGSYTGGTQDMMLRSGTLVVGTSTNSSSTGGHVGIWGLRGYSNYLSITNADAGSSTFGDVFQITSAGRVGIASSTPWAMLSVAATANASTPQFVVASSSAVSLLVAASGNVGIGTSTPGSILAVQGVANFTTATSTFFSSGGINLTGGCFAISGNCITSQNGLIAVYATSTVGTTTVNFAGAVNSSPSFSGGVLTLPSNTTYATIEVWGGGGGGGGSGTGNSGGTGGAGGTTCFGPNATACSSPTLSATGGTAGNGLNDGGAGGAGSGGDVNMTGQSGGSTTANPTYSSNGGIGGSAPNGGGGGRGQNNGAGVAGAVFGGGGGGAGLTANTTVGGGGGGAGYSTKLITSLSSSYTFAVGTGGTAGAAGTSGFAGGAGGAGGVKITLYTSASSIAGLGSSQSPTVTTLTSGSGTYNVPVGVSYVRVRMVGGGGGGGGSGNTSANTGSTGGTTSFGSFTAVGGTGGTGGTGAAVGGSGAGGSGGAGTANIRIPGTAGSTAGGHAAAINPVVSGYGGGTPFGGGGAPPAVSTVGGAGVANTGGGGAGAGGNNSLTFGGGGGGGGEYVEIIITSPSASYSYGLGAGGGGGTGSGSGATTGGAGGSGIIIIDEYYGSSSNISSSGIINSGVAGQLSFFASNGTTLTGTSTIFLSTAGNLGIGTTTPWARLSVTSPSQQNGNLALFSVASTTGASLFNIQGNGRVGIGTTTPTSVLSIADSGATPYTVSGNLFGVFRDAIATGETIALLSTDDASASNEYFIAMGSEVDTALDNEFLFRTDGTALADGSWSGGGADYAEYVTPEPGTEVGDYPKGSLICVFTGEPDSYGFCDGANDSRVVGVISTFPAIVGNSPALALDEVQREETHILLSMLGRVPLRVSLEGGPIAIGDRLAASSVPGVAMKATSTARTVGIALDSYTSETASSTIMLYIDPELTLAGFELESIAELAAFATSTPEAPLSNWMEGFMTRIYASLTEWFASVENGIGDLFASKVHTKELCVEKSDGSEVCVTGDQLAAVLAGIDAEGGDSGGGEGDQQSGESEDTIDPVITITGANPATIEVGQIYSDLGAIVSDAGSPNIGISATVNGGATTTIEMISIDTAQPGTHSIIYSATDQAGNTGTAERTVNVVEPETP